MAPGFSLSAPMRLRRLLTLTLVGAVAGAAACNDDTGIVVLRPQGAFEPVSVDFGEVPVGMSSTIPVVLKNTGTPPLPMDRIDVPASFAVDAGKGVYAGQLVPAGEFVELQVTFLAASEGEKSGQVVLTAETVEIVLDVKGTGVIRRQPMLSAQPAALDFGTVEVNTEARLTTTITNSGNAPGVIDAASLASTGAAMAPTDTYTLATALPITIAEGSSAQVEVVFRPTAAGAAADTINLGVAGGAAPVQIAVNGEGRIPNGELICSPSTVDFGQVQRGMVGANMVACTARGGDTRLIGATLPPQTQLFRLPMPVSTTDLTDGSSVLIPVEFEAQGLPQQHQSTITVSFAGPNGVANTTVPLRGEVIPPPSTATALTVRLRWDTNFTDLDVHLVRPGGRAFDFTGNSDCFYAVKAPDWNMVGSNADDPFLDQDDVDGLGPEEINLQTTAPGRYRVLAHYYSDRGFGRSQATVEVFVAGQPAGTFTQNLGCNDLWNVGTLDWNGTSGTFIPNGVTQTAREGVCLGN